MKTYKHLGFIILSVILFNCGSNKTSEESNFIFETKGLKEQYQSTETVILELKSLKDDKFDSIVYSINDEKTVTKKDISKISVSLANKKLGYQNIRAVIYLNGSYQETTTRIELVSSIEPKLLKYKLINTYPHDTLSFTEGLEFYKDTLYESAGQYSKSKLLKTDYKTGKILKSFKLEDKYFAEGITFINDKIYQLTYKEKVGFIYDAKTWKLEKTFVYDKPEGWGMTNDGTNIYFNDSSEKIWTMSPETQKSTDYINTYSSSSKLKEINELEWIEGSIFSNVWQKDFIVKINPKSGAIEGVLDLKDLKAQIKSKSADVLNGIAYNKKTKTIFITGKNWDKMFEIKIID